MKTTQLYWRMLVVFAALFATSCSNYDDGEATVVNSDATDEMMRESNQNPDEAVFTDDPIATKGHGYVYIEGNELGTNQIYIFKEADKGNLEYYSRVLSGGAGNGMALGSQGAVILSQDHTYLYAVNAGSNSISQFKVHPDGNLSLLNTKGSGGTTPVSLTMFKNRLYVVHSGDGTIDGFLIDETGAFHQIAGSQHKLSDDLAAPGQISFSPNGRQLYVTEKKTNKISMFPVNEHGVAGERVSIPSVGNTPFGFDYARSYMIVSNAGMTMPGASSVTSYNGINGSMLNPVGGEVPNGQTAACWVATTKFGRFAFVTNTGSDNMSSYYIAPGGMPHLVESRIKTSDSPSDIVVAANNFNVYVLCAMNRTVDVYTRTQLGGLEYLDKVTNIPQSAAGMASW
jgi:6-phosphogluconolactonase